MADGDLKIMAAQMNPVAGDLGGNLELARRALAEGEAQGADLVALPEMFLSGYQVLDLSSRPAFVRDCNEAVAALAQATRPGGPAIGAGAPMGGQHGVYNAWHLCQDGQVRTSFRKHHRPNYGVFDENRLYLEGPAPGPVEIAGVRVGFPICEDMWFPDVAETLQEAGAELFVVPNGSPYERGKLDVRMVHMVSRVVETGLPLLYLNLIGGQDDQVFDGASFVLNPGGVLAAQMPYFEECFQTLEVERVNGAMRFRPHELPPVPDAAELDWRAMVVAVHDYVTKSGFSKVLLGLSGGIDSALTAAIATDALGADNVRCVRLPSKFSSAHGLEDAEKVARALGCRLDTIEIHGAVEAVEAELEPLFAETQRGVAEENIQSRLRGVYLMALANKFDELLLTTGNKSELAVGYATIYGDMNGAYNPIKDLWKTRVFECARWRNTHHFDWMKGPKGQVIPERVITKPPSAELRPDQKDEDSLPPYEVLDHILIRLVEDDWSVEEIVWEGYEHDTVEHVQELLYRNEWKRYQSAPGVKLTKKAFWLDRRYPIVNRWRDRR